MCKRCDLSRAMRDLSRVPKTEKKLDGCWKSWIRVSKGTICGRPLGRAGRDRVLSSESRAVPEQAKQSRLDF
jgi:hypothetical protein